MTVIDSPSHPAHHPLPASAPSELRWQKFALMVAHDLKEPIRNIGSCARLLADMGNEGADVDVDEAQVRQWLLDSSERLVHMMDALVNHAKYGREEFEQRLDLGEVVQGIKADLRCMIKRTGGSVECTTPMPRVEAGPLGMRMVFQNLIENALKYAKPGERPVVRLSAERLNAGWLFRCTDEGKGMSQHQVDHAFDAFRRFDARSEGMGMGLCHVRQIIEAYEGSIWLESLLGEGTTVALTLPEYQAS
jgi:light-regulated signal transduction histidine kinase (bacteriophytochrome)